MRNASIPKIQWAIPRFCQQLNGHLAWLAIIITMDHDAPCLDQIQTKRAQFDVPWLPFPLERKWEHDQTKPLLDHEPYWGISTLPIINLKLALSGWDSRQSFKVDLYLLRKPPHVYFPCNNLVVDSYSKIKELLPEVENFFFGIEKLDGYLQPLVWFYPGSFNSFSKHSVLHYYYTNNPLTHQKCIFHLISPRTMGDPRMVMGKSEEKWDFNWELALVNSPSLFGLGRFFFLLVVVVIAVSNRQKTRAPSWFLFRFQACSGMSLAAVPSFSPLLHFSMWLCWPGILPLISNKICFFI